MITHMKTFAAPPVVNALFQFIAMTDGGPLSLLHAVQKITPRPTVTFAMDGTAGMSPTSAEARLGSCFAWPRHDPGWV
jgi:hypothetical protein